MTVNKDDPNEPDFEWFYGKGQQAMARCVCKHEFKIPGFVGAIKSLTCKKCGRVRHYKCVAV